MKSSIASRKRRLSARYPHLPLSLRRLLSPQASEAAAGLAEINRKRLLEYSKNLDYTREQILIKQQNELEGKGGAEEDPFARRKTFVSYGYLTKGKKEEEKKEEKDGEHKEAAATSQPESSQVSLDLDASASGGAAVPTTPRAPVGSPPPPSPHPPYSFQRALWRPTRSPPRRRARR